jgi:hypothetical protein
MSARHDLFECSAIWMLCMGFGGWQGRRERSHLKQVPSAGLAHSVEAVVGLLYDAGIQAVATATRTGVAGGLAALTALERGPMQRVLLQGLPAQGGFVAAYSGACQAWCRPEWRSQWLVAIGFSPLSSLHQRVSQLRDWRPECKAPGCSNGVGSGHHACRLCPPSCIT